MITQTEARRRYSNANSAGEGYAPYTDEPGTDTFEGAIEAAEADGWTVVLRAENGDDITVLENEDGELMGYGDANGVWAVPLGNNMTVYTYSIFDSNPSASDGNVWPSHENIEIEAESDEDAVNQVRQVMSVEAAGLNASDGYNVDQRLHARVWGESESIVGSPTYEITANDLGVEDTSDEGDDVTDSLTVDEE